METEILRPHYVFGKRIGAPLAQFSRRSSSYGNFNYNSCHCRSNRKQTVRSDRQDHWRRNPLISRRLIQDDVKMAKVSILRRGKSLDSKINTNTMRRFKGDDLALYVTERIGRDPELVPKPNRKVDMWSSVPGKCEVYAGSGFSMSPSPRSVPLPSFQKKSQGWKMGDESATKDLRRLLRLDA